MMKPLTVSFVAITLLFLELNVSRSQDGMPSAVELSSEAVNCTREEMQAVRDLCENGAQVRFCWELLDADKRPLSCDSKDVVHNVRLHPYKGTDGDLERITHLSGIQMVDLRHCFRISDAGMKFLCQIDSLKEIRLSLNSSEHASEDALPGFLKGAEIPMRAKLTDSGLEQLGHIESLEHLDISGNPFSNAAICSFPGLPRLKHLVLSDNQISEEQVEKLRAQYPNCTVIRKVRDP